MYCRDLTAKFDHVWIVSGPLFLSETNSRTGRKYVHYDVIGRNEVAVPTHLFKIVVAEKQGIVGKPLLGVFVVPNAAISSDRQLREYKVDLEFVESHTGLQFLPLLDRRKSSDLCSIAGCHLAPLPIAFGG